MSQGHSAKYHEVIFNRSIFVFRHQTRTVDQLLLAFLFCRNIVKQKIKDSRAGDIKKILEKEVNEMRARIKRKNGV